MHCGTAIWSDWCHSLRRLHLIDVCDTSTGIRGLTHGQTFCRSPRRGVHSLRCSLYEDGTRTSNRKVPGSELGEVDGDLHAKAYIEAQDRKIVEISGKPRAPIKSLTRARRR